MFQARGGFGDGVRLGDPTQFKALIASPFDQLLFNLQHGHAP
jgi:hypothetical protein